MCRRATRTSSSSTRASYGACVPRSQSASTERCMAAAAPRTSAARTSRPELLGAGSIRRVILRSRNVLGHGAASIHIDGERIARVAGYDDAGAEVIDYGDLVLMPGVVD